MTGRNCTSLIIHAKAGCLEKRDYKSDGGQITQWSNVISFQSISNVQQSTTENSASQFHKKHTTRTTDVFRIVHLYLRQKQGLVSYKLLKSWLKYF